MAQCMYCNEEIAQEKTCPLCGREQADKAAGPNQTATSDNGVLTPITNVSPTDATSSMQQDNVTGQAEGNSRTKAIICIAAGIGVFIVCSIIQGVGGSSMFANTYVTTNNETLDMLMSVTWWPGWVATVLFIIAGVRLLFTKK